MAFRLEPGCLTLAAALCAAGAAAQTVIYSDSSTPDKLQSKVGVGVDEGGLALQAGVTMIGQDGVTRVLPRITSEWKGLDFLDLDTVLSYDDLNGEGLAPTVDTSLLLKSNVAFVERVEGSLRRKDASTSESVRIRFTRLDTDFAVLGGNPFGVATDVVTQTDGGLRRISSNIESSWGIGQALDMKTVLRLDDSVAGAGTAVDTSFAYASPLGFIDRVEGSVQRSSGGVRQSLGLHFSEFSQGDPYGSSFKISSRAIVEEMLAPGGDETLSMGVETKLIGVRPPLLGGSSALSLRLDRQLDEIDALTSTLAYDHSWSPGDASIGLNLKLLRRLDSVEPSMGVSWSAKF